MKKPILTKAILQQFNRENFKKLFQFLIASFIINLFVELLARRSPNDTVLFIVDSPLLFLYGILIIFFSLSLSLLFKRQRFWFMLFSSVWVALAVTDCITADFLTARISLTISRVHITITALPIRFLPAF